MSDTSARHPVDPRPASGQPTLRTLLLLDLADSTALVDRLGDQRAAELVRRHDRLARDLLRRHHGREIDKTEGFLLLFERPVQAVAFALEYQRRLKELARLERVDLAARLMALALPGQILVSSVAHELAERAEVELTASGRLLEWRDHGCYRFKGVTDAVSVHEVGESDVAHFRTPPGSSKAQRILPWWRRPPAIAALVLRCSHWLPSVHGRCCAPSPASPSPRATGWWWANWSTPPASRCWTIPSTLPSARAWRNRATSTC